MYNIVNNFYLILNFDKKIKLAFYIFELMGNIKFLQQNIDQNHLKMLLDKMLLLALLKMQ